eukprot:scaffold79410_cov21-Phaeocystis_antarctica.AAC.1
MWAALFFSGALTLDSGFPDSESGQPTHSSVCLPTPDGLRTPDSGPVRTSPDSGLRTPDQSGP